MDDIVVLKCGGSMIDSLSDSFFENIKSLQESGLKPIIVHGGGPAIKTMLDKQQIPSEFVDGLRKTTKPVLEVVEMVLTGMVMNSLVRKLNDSGINALGMSGSDANLIQVKALNFEKYGYVGEVTKVNTSLIESIIELGIVPVIAPIGLCVEGTRYNVNADTAAGAVGKALNAEQLVFITDVPGILKDDELLEATSEDEINDMIESGIIHGGMIPKVKAAVDCLGDSMDEAMIVDGNQAVIKSSEGKLVGTVIKKSVGVF